VVTRRALLAGGAVLLAGCGKDLASQPQLPAPSEALSSQLAAERGLQAALSGLEARAPRRDRALVRRLSARSSERTRRISAAAVAEGGRPSDAPVREDAAPDPEVAAARARKALATHVEALPALRRGELRGLGTELVIEAAEDLAMIGAVFRLTTVEAFPGTTA
jgi:hypothetical protein